MTGISDRGARRVPAWQGSLCVDMGYTDHDMMDIVTEEDSQDAESQGLEWPGRTARMLRARGLQGR